MLRMAIDEPKPLHLLEPKSVEEAVALGTEHWPDAAYLAGGCDLLDQLKHQWHNPRTVINLKGVASMKGVRQASGMVTLGALTRLGEIERDQSLRKTLPALVLAASRIATPQIRNRGTVGGNLLQDSRCPYYRGGWYCYRAGGIACDAKHGINKEHAIFGGDRCYTVTPSDLAPVMVALDARLHIQEANHPAEIPAQALFLSPSYDITHMHMMNQGQILTAVSIPLVAGQRSTFIKYAPRNAWDFSRASVAVAVTDAGGVARNCRIVLGGVAAIPWRSRDAEHTVEGQRLTPPVIEAAAQAATNGADALPYNGYKVPLVKKLVRDALTQLAA